MERVEGILDVDAQPPYVEVFSNHPLMFLSLCNHRLACLKSSPKEVLFWSHGVQCTIDDIVSNLGLYKIKVWGCQGPSCMFVTSPDMPPKQQADAMFAAAKQLRALLSKVEIAGADTLASQITIHAGSYAGGVVGKTSWSYDLFGSDVQDLLDMDRFNTPNNIQVSDPALKLLSDVQQFAPACKLVCSGREVMLHRWVDKASPRVSVDSRASAALRVSSAQEQLPAMLPSPVKCPQALVQQPFGADDPYSSQQPPYCKSVSWSHSDMLAAAGAALPGCMRQDLRFTDSSLEEAYLRSQVQQWSRMDMVFVALVICTMAGLACSSGVSMRFVLAGFGQWTVPVAAAIWFCLQKDSYYHRREMLWVLHRVLTAVHLAGVLLHCILQQRQQQLAVFSGVAALDSSGTHAAPNVQQGVVGMLRSGAVLMLLGNLGFKVRLSAHLLTLALSAAVAVLGVAWQWSSSSAVHGASLAPWLWELLLRLTLGCLAPTALLYWWERDDRTVFLARTHHDASCKIKGQVMASVFASKPKLA